MQKNIKKIASISALVFVVGFIGAFFGKSFRQTKLGRSIERKLGIEPQVRRIETATGQSCIQESEQDNSALFVGCNGFF